MFCITNHTTVRMYLSRVFLFDLSSSSDIVIIAHRFSHQLNVHSLSGKASASFALASVCPSIAACRLFLNSFVSRLYPDYYISS